MKVEFTIPGLREIEQALQTLPPFLAADVLKRVHRDILNRIVKPSVRTAMRNRRKSITAVSDRQDKTAIILGVSSKNYYMRFVDKGTEQRQTRKGYNRGRIVGDNRITKTIERNEDPVMKELQNNYSQIVIKHLDRKIRSVRKKISNL